MSFIPTRNTAFGIGAYPSDRYYDPDRPAWLPFWFDTPTESALKYELYPSVTTLKNPELTYPTPPPASPPGAPQTEEQMTETGKWTWLDAAQTGQEQSIENWRKFFSEVDAKNQPPDDKETITPWWVWAVLGVGGIVVLNGITR